MIRSKLSYRRLLALTAAGALAAGVGACSSTPAPSSSGKGSTPSGATTLTMESSPENSITQDFNPFVSTAAPQGMGATGLIYEPLLQFDLAAPPKFYYWLATAYTWGAGGKSLTFTIRQGVKWNNGTAMTPADVAFTYNLVKSTAAINLAGLDITSVSTSGDTVTLTFPTAEYTNLQQIAGVPILPKSVWSTAGTPTAFTDATPVGTGPYMLKTFTPQGFTLTKNPNYWNASAVKVQNVYFPVYTSNTGALSALFSGQIDWTGNFIPGLQKQFVSTAPTYHHFWEAPGSTNALMPNLHQWPTNQLAVRKAISLAVNRNLLASEGEAGLENPITNTTGITLPTFSAWSGPVTSDTVSPTGSASQAAAVLTAAGYKKDSAGFFALNGKQVTVTLVSPSSYTDYAEVGSIVAGELKAAGIDASFNGLTVDAWNADMADGDFQLAEHWSNNGLTPYNLYDNWLNSALDAGNNATGDYERLNDPALDADLGKLAGDQSVTQQTQDLIPIETYVSQNLPVIPITTASEWFEYNSQRFVGWPTQQDPYETGQPSGTNNSAGSGTDEVVLLHLSPRT
ncbi:MAG TPA: ABC transporter substrate-binding protein [Streptosporangiaceae bacterium]|jgi:peptide/nickel transport system substrate-binding protein|nr:ABC transporter substrate-binding protein [Streptosporangiaceae bacterium]